MRKANKVLYYYLRCKILNIYSKGKIENISKKYAGRILLSREETNINIAKMIKRDSAFFIGRFGASELFCASSFEFSIHRFEEKSMTQLCEWSGFFPNRIEYGVKFNECLINSAKEVDMLAVWGLRFEEYYINQYMKHSLKLINLLDLEPWRCPDNPWSAALKNKKVLVIHPFEETIISQYRRREKIFPGTEILPKFELRTLKAVQTLAGEKDLRFNDWFEALEWMYVQALKIDFDVAIIGCGAYGFALAAKIKSVGKQAIHLGGATQILFGIKGKRWDEIKTYEYVRKFYNDYWVYPKEKISKMEKVEGGCYW